VLCISASMLPVYFLALLFCRTIQWSVGVSLAPQMPPRNFIFSVYVASDVGIIASGLSWA
jgi:hypothetical protein